MTSLPHSVARHARVLGHAWSEETKRRRADRMRWTDTEFLPAALEVTETPPSPAGRMILWIIVAAALLSLIWACLSEVDTVAVAQGRLVPSGRLRSVEAADQGVIHAILVKEGQHVTAGQTLLELDPTAANADAQSARTDLATAQLTRARDAALLAYAGGHAPSFVAPPGAALPATDAERLLIAARIAALQAKMASFAERREGAAATAAASQAEIDKLRATLPLLKEQVDQQKNLERQGYGAREKLLQDEQAYVSAQGDLQAELARLSEARAQVSAIAGDMAEAKGDFISDTAKEQSEAESVVATRSDAVRKADQRQSLQRLTAPVSGIVQELTVTNVGEAPEIGKPLVTIVPDGEPLVVEALLLNRDAGFVRAGQPVVVKLDAYPFTRYGALDGVVERVSPDSTVDQQRGLVFPVRVRLTGSRLRVEGRPAVLSPGMSATAEVVTGHRRVIDYLWSPVAKTVSEAGRER